MFAAVLLAAVLVSELASRSVLSTSVLFLAAGFAAGPALAGWVDVDPEGRQVRTVAELALFAVLFTDGMRIGARELVRAWRLPGRALLLGMPLTFAGTAALGRWLADLSWPEALLIGAALSPTDPVFASAIVGRQEVPLRLRRLLNVESGVNDGLALPVVLLLLVWMGAGHSEPTRLLGELALGIAIGVAVPWAALWLESRRAFAAHRVYEPLLAFAIALLVFALTALTHANEFLAAFAAGVTVASVSERARDDFHRFGEVATELFKLGALLLFGALISPAFFLEFGPAAYVFVALVLVAVRPVAVSLALAGTPLGWRETAVAAWFGPKGFASVVYGLLILNAGLERAPHLFHLIAIVIAVSIVAHSSTDVLVARWLHRNGAAAADAPPAEEAAPRSPHGG